MGLALCFARIVRTSMTATDERVAGSRRRHSTGTVGVHSTDVCTIGVSAFRLSVLHCKLRCNTSDETPFCRR